MSVVRRRWAVLCYSQECLDIGEFSDEATALVAAETHADERQHWVEVVAQVLVEPT